MNQAEPPDEAEPTPADQAAPAPPGGGEEAEGPKREAVTEPAKLLRIAAMTRELLEETRTASLDEAGRIRLRQIYERSLMELEDSLSDDLKEELAAFVQPLDGVPSESEMRVAQAQLVGWLEGLFHGIQAAIAAQQQAAMQQLTELRRRGLPGPPHMAVPGPPAQAPPDQPPTPGQYL